MWGIRWRQRMDRCTRMKRMVGGARWGCRAMSLHGWGRIAPREASIVRRGAPGSVRAEEALGKAPHAVG